MAQNIATFTFEDYNRETSSFQINVGPLTALNFTATRDAIDDLKNTLGGITRGAHRKTVINEQFTESVAAVTDQQAQREAKWLVTYRDNDQFLDVGNTINNTGFGNLYSIEIPTADLSLLDNNSDELDLTVTAVADFITAFEAIQKSPTGGSDCQVVSIRHVGRSY